jgi:hypothetical protein
MQGKSRVNAETGGHLIEAPPIERGLDAGLVLAIAALFALSPLMHGGALVALTGALALATAVGAGRRNRPASGLGVFCTAVALASILEVPYRIVVCIAVYAATVASTPWLRGSAGWARRGSFGRDVQALVIASVVISSAALVLWVLLLRPDLGDLLGASPLKAAPWVLVPTVVGFATMEAAIEEVAYRGIVLDALDAALGAGWAPVLLQAIMFGIAHIHGFPRGWSGVALASVYGLMMGVVRRRARGMFAPWLAHVFADATIACILIALGR